MERILYEFFLGAAMFTALDGEAWPLVSETSAVIQGVEPIESSPHAWLSLFCA
jgi:hypothetical protein